MVPGTQIGFGLVLFMCFTTIVNAGRPGFIIEGCLHDSGNSSQVLSHKLESISLLMKTNTSLRQPAPCAEACLELGFHHAGLRNSWECWCGEDVVRTRNARRCPRCEGDSHHLCGDTDIMALYDLPEVWPRYRYRGCFRYVTQQQIRLLLPHTQWTMTEAAHWWGDLRQPGVCVKWCVEAGFRYAGWAHNYECHCGNTLVNTGQTVCDPCFSDRRSKCGGRSQMAVYEVIQAPPKASICGSRRPHAVLGYPLSLHCEATGDYPIKIEWLRVNTSDSKHYIPIEVDSHIFYSEGELTFSEIREPDVGSYVCQATNQKILSKFQQVSTLKATLQLQVPPQVNISQVNDVPAMMGSVATLRCDIVGDKPMIIRWTKDGEVLDATAHDRYEVEIMENQTAKLLHISGLSMEDNGTYGCQATNARIRYKQGQVAETSVSLLMDLPALTNPPIGNDISGNSTLPDGDGGKDNNLMLIIIILVVVQFIIIIIVIIVVVLARRRLKKKDSDLYSVPASRPIYQSTKPKQQDVAPPLPSVSAPVPEPAMAELTLHDNSALASNPGAADEGLEELALGEDRYKF